MITKTQENIFVEEFPNPQLRNIPQTIQHKFTIEDIDNQIANLEKAIENLKQKKADCLKL
jgi:hypothetical protein